MMTSISRQVHAPRESLTRPLPRRPVSRGSPPLRRLLMVAGVGVGAVAVLPPPPPPLRVPLPSCAVSSDIRRSTVKTDNSGHPFAATSCPVNTSPYAFRRPTPRPSLVRTCPLVLCPAHL